MNHFIQTMQRVWKRLKHANRYNKINMTADDTAHHSEQTQCLLRKCESVKGKLVKHHDHEKKKKKITLELIAIDATLK